MIQKEDMRRLEDLAFEIIKQIRVYNRTDDIQRRDKFFFKEIKGIANHIENWADTQEFKVK